MDWMLLSTRNSYSLYLVTIGGLLFCDTLLQNVLPVSEVMDRRGFKLLISVGVW